MNHALVSVVIPCYNYGRYLSEAIESVLGQTYREVEIIVVDDGSRDDSVQIARSYPNVKVIEQENQGLAAALNTGFRHSQGDYLVFFDADDRLPPRALELHLAALAANPSAAMSFGICELIDAEGKLFTWPVKVRPVTEDFRAELLRTNFIWTPGAVMFRRSVVTALGGFRGTYYGLVDYEMYLRLVRKYSMVPVSDVVVQWRRHGNNMSSNSARLAKSFLRLMRAQRPFTREPRLRRILHKTLMTRLIFSTILQISPHTGSKLLWLLWLRSKRKQWER